MGFFSGGLVSAIAWSDWDNVIMTMMPSGSGEGEKLPLPAREESPVPSLSSDEWIDRTYGDGSQASSLPPHQEQPAAPMQPRGEAGNNAESSRPTVSQQGSIPGENEPGAQPAGGGQAVAPVPSHPQVIASIDRFINSFRRKRRAPGTMIHSIAEEIGLAEASPAKRQAIIGIIDAIRDHPNSITGRGVINSGENARAELTELPIL